jgi:DNA mismatch endonuclease (patch repair protein)
MRGSRPEIALRRELHRRGLRFYVEYRKAPGTPDLAFPSRRLAVFVDGDLWHGHILERTPAAWRQKIDANSRRDAAVNRELERLGWTVLRIREREIYRNLEACVDAVTRSLQNV